MQTAEAKKLTTSPGTNILLLGMVAIGVATFALGLFTDATRIWRVYLLNHALFLGLGVGASFFLVVHYMAMSGWVVAVRRIPEAMASYFFVAVLFHIVLLFGLSKIYPWTNHELMHSDHFLHHKTGYFSHTFYIIRAAAFFGLIGLLVCKILGLSHKQDETGGAEGIQRQKRLGAIFLVCFAPMFTLFSVDLIKSLEPKWFSTIFGVYVFTGFVQASIAVMILSVRFLKKHGYLEFVTADHYHDLGKYMFGFSIFWAYIGVSQYLLIWYANLPEETFYYILRQKPGWLAVSILLPILRFALPFLLLLPRAAKRNSGYLSFVACIVLLGAWVDLNWMIMPSLFGDGFRVGWQELGLLIGFIGIFSLVVRRYWTKHSLIPSKDPFVHETLHHHVM